MAPGGGPNIARDAACAAACAAEAATAAIWGPAAAAASAVQRLTSSIDCWEARRGLYEHASMRRLEVNEPTVLRPAVHKGSRYHWCALMLATDNSSLVACGMRDMTEWPCCV